MNRAFSELAEAEILSPMDKRGVYRVSPILFFNGSEKKRQQLIRKILEEPYTGIIEGIRRAK